MVGIDVGGYGNRKDLAKAGDGGRDDWNMVAFGGL